jgi:phosphinothricin acetyltransferase
MIRMASEADAGAIAGIYGPEVAATPISFELLPPSTAEMARRIAAVLRTAPWLVAEEAGQVLGYAYASPHHERAAYCWSVDVSVYIHAGQRGRRVGRALYTSLFALLLRQGFYTVHAGITLPNPASVALHERFGFRPIGVYAAVGFKLGAWHDVGWWQLPLRERVGQPAPPRSMAQAASAPGFEEALAAGDALVRK